MPSLVSSSARPAAAARSGKATFWVLLFSCGPALAADPAPEPAQPSAETPTAETTAPEAALPAPPPESVPQSSQPPPPLEPSGVGRPVIDVSVPEPPPPQERSYHFHDGFYLRANAGLLAGRAHVSTDSVTHANHTIGGGGISLDLLIGGSPSPGMAVGGGLMLQGYNDRRVENSGGSGTGSLTLLGVFVDGFPRPNKGLHFGGLFGVAASNTTRQDGRDEFEGGGLGMAVWLGHDFWVGDEWSLGGLLRLNGALLRDASEEDAADPVTLANTSYGIGLAFTVLYH